MKPDVTPIGKKAPYYSVAPCHLNADQWERVCALFEKILDTGDLRPLETEPDRPVADEALRLYEQHLKAASEGFLNEPITLVRDLSEGEKPAFTSGQLLAGRFRVSRLLGAGGMGEVYLAEDLKLGETVAIKTMRLSLARDQRFRSGFVSEVQNARKVTHPNVCRIFDLFEDGETPFYSMEFVSGSRLDQFASAGVTPAIARSVVLQLAEGLHAAHQSGVIHGDFKPQNVIVLPAADALPRAVITDFGLACKLDSSSGSYSRSWEAGTPDYRAPELVAGGAPSVRSDIYAFGKVAAKILPAWKNDCCKDSPEARPASLTPVIAELRNPGYARRWILAGMGAAALGAGGLAYKRWMSPALPLPSRQRILLNGFAAAPSLEERAGMVRELLLAGLRQSPLLAIVPDERLHAALLTLKLPASLPASLSNLSAAARHENVAMILDGALQPLSRGLGLILQIFLPGRDRPLMRLEPSVDDDRQMVRLADQAAAQLRMLLGESKLALQSSHAPLEQVTSASPEAVEYYFRAVREYERTDTQAALAFLDRALAIDPQFAMAHHYRAICLWVSTQTEKAMDATSQAFRLRHRVTEHERNWIEFYYYNLCGDYLGSLSSIRKNAILFPEESVFQRQTASTYCQIRQYDSVIPYNLRAIELDPFSELPRSEHIVNLVSCGKPQEALDVYRRYRAEGITTTMLEWGAGLAGLALGDYAAAEQRFTVLGSTSRRERWSRVLLAGPAILRGQFVQAALNLEAELALDDALGDGLRRYQRLQLLTTTRQLMGQPRLAWKSAAALCALPAQGPSLRYLRAGVTAAVELGDFDLAQQALTTLREIENKWPSTHSQGARAHAEGWMRLFSKGFEADADTWITRARGIWPDPQTLFAVAEWHARRGRLEQQLKSLDDLLRLRGAMHRDDFHALVVQAWIAQARALTKLSRSSEALRLYKQILEHWGANARDFPIVSRIRSEFEHLNH